MSGSHKGDGGRPDDEAHRSENRSENRSEDRSEARARVEGEALEDVLASIRALVSAETSARLGRADAGEPVLMLTPAMRVEEEAPVRSGELLAEGLDAAPLAPRATSAPILDEEALRGVVNRIVREELQGELGDRISRNLRKLIRREIGQLLAARKEEP